MNCITTKRFRLRPIERGDAAELAVLCNDADIARNTARIPHPYTQEHAAAFVDYAVRSLANKSEYVFAICKTDEIIGCVGVFTESAGVYELGYWVGQRHRGQGVATETAIALVEFAFTQLGAGTITAGHFVDNPASRRVLKKAGFHPTGEVVMMFSTGRGEEVETIRFVRSK